MGRSLTLRTNTQLLDNFGGRLVMRPLLPAVTSPQVISGSDRDRQRQRICNNPDRHCAD